MERETSGKKIKGRWCNTDPALRQYEGMQMNEPTELQTSARMADSIQTTRGRTEGRR